MTNWWWNVKKWRKPWAGPSWSSLCLKRKQEVSCKTRRWVWNQEGLLCNNKHHIIFNVRLELWGKHGAIQAERCVCAWVGDELVPPHCCVVGDNSRTTHEQSSRCVSLTNTVTSSFLSFLISASFFQIDTFYIIFSTDGMFFLRCSVTSAATVEVEPAAESLLSL